VGEPRKRVTQAKGALDVPAVQKTTTPRIPSCGLTRRQAPSVRVALVQERINGLAGTAVKGNVTR
jgi:hypothetical protein